MLTNDKFTLIVKEIFKLTKNMKKRFFGCLENN